MMNRQRLYGIRAAWLMLVLLIGCVPTTNELEPQAAESQNVGAASEAVATAVPTTAATPISEESTMNNDATRPPADVLELNTPQPEKPGLQNPPPLALDSAVAAKPVIPVPDSPAIQEQVNKAKDDLAKQLGIDTAQIDLVEYQAVTWRDGSLGCPKPDMAYTQALVEGYRMQLQVNGVQYNYHGAAGRDPFYCQNPIGLYDSEEIVPAPGVNET
ncbi:MAG: hypothetical protein H6667_14715 [Ardenticatenaceae bacterium]|nr:hypothetical protein [Ardenticatenaceae bacterium]MCB9446625.1 hypothetical protein [Ardenticatenaceae bacterium]